MLDLQMLKETEERFESRRVQRETNKTKLQTGPILEVDTPERVKTRLGRLGFDLETGDRILRGDYASEVSAAPGAAPPVSVNTLERILGNNDLMGIDFLDMGLCVARCVGRIRIRDARRRIVGFGTGFMVSPRLMLTNNHVLPDNQTAQCSQIEFNYQESVLGRPMRSAVFDLEPGVFFVTDKHLDHSVVAVQTQDSAGTLLSSFGWTGLIEQTGKIILGEYLNIIQHPNGEFKQLALRDNHLVDLLDDFLHYETDTSPGSSGSPVFNDQWEVVALHHSGVPKKDESGRILAINGNPWTRDMGEQRIAWIANEGARVSRISAHLKNQNLTPAQQELLRDVFELPQPIGGTEIGEPPPGLIPSYTPLGSPVVSREGTAIWSIPLQVSVRLGAPFSPPTAEAPAQDQPRPTPTPTEIPTPPEEPELAAILSDLQAARTKPYYDAEKDQQDRDLYYQDVNTSAAPDELFRLLKDKLRRTHKDWLPYSPSKHVYTWVDLQPNLMLRSIYSDIEYDPQRIIREDFRIDRERQERFREILLAEADLTPQRVAEELAQLEASLPYNCEHVVCQSWFGKREPMRGDLHHLFTCESGCNSFRGNAPYFDFVDFQESMRDGCGKREDPGFEPCAGRGKVGRAALYFLLRYPGEINQDIFKITDERIDILLEWHRHDPVTEHERHRNAAIFEKQGNRNPLIDFPEWADKINFALGGE
jgi:endonuclease G, mitochondrial